MKPADFDPFDWKRIAVGDPSWPFLIEVAGRAAVTYAVLLLAMRVLGRRVAGQATLFEMSVVVTLAAAIGAALQAPDRGLLAPVLILTTCVALERGLGAWGVKRPALERLTSGSATTLLRDGEILVEAMRATVLSRDKLFALLRAHQVQHLGELHRVSLEANGEISLVKRTTAIPGLSVFPEDDTELREEARAEGHACDGCGHVEPHPAAACPACGHDTWSPCTKKLER